MNHSNSTRTRSIQIFILLFALASGACDSTGSTTSAPPPETTTSTTTTVPPPSTTTAPGTGRVLEVPAQAPPVIDGVLGAGEWDGSVTVAMSDDSSLHWMHEDGVLYVALESAAIGAVNLLVATEDEVWILHSSAALGSALYLPGDGVWDLSHGFDWCCRTATDDSARLELLDNEGWQATIGFTGDEGIVEYEVTLPWGGASVAVSYLTNSDTSAFWPADLSFEARQQLIGPWSDERVFKIEEWYTLVPIDG